MMMAVVYVIVLELFVDLMSTLNTRGR